MLRNFKRKFSISTQRLAVRPHVPWYVRWALILPFVLVVGGLVWWAYDTGLEFAGFHRSQTASELESLHRQVAELKSGNAQLTSLAAANERQAQIDHAANLETARQLKNLNEENAQLKEDLAFFQNLTIPGKHEGELSIHRLKLEHDTMPGEFRYRFLLVRNGEPRAKDFQGNIQLLVKVLLDGKDAILLFPVNPAGDAESQLDFKYYQHVERSFTLPPNAQLVSAQLRVFERGDNEPKVRMDVALSQG
jgi:hypothetical protein